MFALLEESQIEAIYGDLVTRLAHRTPDMLTAIRFVAAEVKAVEGEWILSDMHRSHEMQFLAHLE
jgi:hypothetical protein